MWSWALGTISIASIALSWHAGSGYRWAWAVKAVVQVPWAVYAITTRQWGFLMSSVAYAVVYVRNSRTEGEVKS